jgi:HlyD family secretion protein
VATIDRQGNGLPELRESAEGNMKKIIALLALLAVLAGAGYWHWGVRAATQTTFRFDEVKRGRLVATIGSTGTLQPREVVDVGAQVAGPIIFIGKDSNTQSGIVDWGSVVQGPELDKDGAVIKKGTVLAQIDDALYKAQFNSAEAAVKSAQADLLQKTAVLHQATSDWNRAQKLYSTAGIAQAEYDQFRANFEVAQANVEVSKANIGVAQANMRTSQTNLNYTTITSPVNGVVIDRRVNVGQTVVASLSAPSLFLIAKDLSKMEVWATVNEVDVGKIKIGQDVKFTVDAYPGRVYRGKVVPQGKLSKRLNATMNQNVVTYTVVVSVDNKDLTLDPYLTTNLSFIVEDKKNALLVPNAALRWQPAQRQIAPDVRDAYNKLRGKKRTPTDAEAQDHGFVWVKGDDGFVRYVEVRTGASDSVNTEIVGVVGDGELPEHTSIIVGEGKVGSEGGSANPFAPQMFKPKAKE